MTPSWCLKTISLLFYIEFVMERGLKSLEYWSYKGHKSSQPKVTHATERQLITIWFLSYTEETGHVLAVPHPGDGLSLSSCQPGCQQTAVGEFIRMAGQCTVMSLSSAPFRG